MPALKASRKSSWPPHPPANENEEDTRRRIEQEAEAKRVSESIDRALNAEQEQLKKQSPGAKILLLGMFSLRSFFFHWISYLLIGQAESGKSTVLKNFQLYLSPKAFDADVRPFFFLNCFFELPPRVGYRLLCGALSYTSTSSAPSTSF